MRNLSLRLEHRSQQARVHGVERRDLLELVEDERYAAASVGRKLRGKLEQPLDRRVDVSCASPRRLE